MSQKIGFLVEETEGGFYRTLIDMENFLAELRAGGAPDDTSIGIQSGASFALEATWRQ